jgi:NAD(P)-dependent dehydrogenase (short-subunit alcohol dehydrogenase family)
MPLELKHRAAVVTGAASGIGRAMALHAAAQGMALALADIDAAGLAAVADTARALGADVLTAPVDVRRREQLDAFAADTCARFKSVALVFANAGVMRAATSWLQPATDWELTVDINLKGAGHTAGAFVPYLLRQPAPSRLVFTGSTSAFLPRPQLSAYSCTKHALWGLAEAMQLELQAMQAPVGISLLAPAGVNTALANAPSDAPGGQMQEAVRALIAAYGMPAEELARLTFAALCAGRVWILPHPEFKDALQARVARLVAETEPVA